MPRRELEKVIEMIRSAGFNRMRSHHDFREISAKLSSLAEPAAAEYRLAHGLQIVPADAAGVPCEWITASDLVDAPVVLYLHGGGFVAGSIRPAAEWVLRVSRAAGARVLGVEYRLAPENPFPCGLEDALNAYRWLVSEVVDPARLAVLGISAGGGLAMAVLVDLRDAGDPLPAATVCLSPQTDHAATGRSVVTKKAVDPWFVPDQFRWLSAAYLAGADPRTPLASPLYADLTGLPPLLVQVGTAEMLLDDSTRVAERARSAGVDVTLEVWEDMIHGWQMFARMLPEGQQAIEHIGDFIRKHLASGGPLRE